MKYHFEKSLESSYIFFDEDEFGNGNASNRGGLFESYGCGWGDGYADGSSYDTDWINISSNVFIDGYGYGDTVDGECGDGNSYGDGSGY
jgi:hypothetical protein